MMEYRFFSVILQRRVIVFGICLISLPLWGWKLIKVIKRDTNGEVTEYQCWLSFSPFWEHKKVTEQRKKRGIERSGFFIAHKMTFSASISQALPVIMRFIYIPNSWVLTNNSKAWHHSTEVVLNLYVQYCTFSLVYVGHLRSM